MKNVLGMVLEKTNEIQWWGVNSVLLTIGRSDRRENKKEFNKESFHLLPREYFFLGKGRMQVVAHFCPKHCLKSEFLLWGHCCLSELSNKCGVNSNLRRFGPCCDHAALSPPTSFPYASSSAQPLPAYPFWALQILFTRLVHRDHRGRGWLMTSCVFLHRTQQLPSLSSMCSSSSLLVNLTPISLLCLVKSTSFIFCFDMNTGHK